MSQRVRLSVVTPCFNEEEGLVSFLSDLRASLDTLGISYEVIVVDDGSTDSSWGVVRNFVWPQLRGVRLLANRGHQVALDAGLRATRGEYVVTMDADGQHPPNVIKDLLDSAIADGVDVVYGIRSDRSEDGWAKRQSAHAYYKLIRGLTGVPVMDSAADFRLMSRNVVDVINEIPDQKIFRLLLPYLGFSSSYVEFRAHTRAFGASKYSFRSMLTLALRSSLQFSTKPLRMVMTIGFVMALIASLWLVWVFVDFATGRTVDGWASQMAVTLIVGGLTLFSVGIVGGYVGELFERLNGRPQFLVRETRDTQRRSDENRDEEVQD